jgi:hypothetical protein
VLLKNRNEVPVSAPYQGMLKELARNANIPIKPAAQKSAEDQPTRATG